MSNVVNEKIVKNHPDYQIDIDFLERLIDDSFNSKSYSFFQNSLEFYKQVQDRHVDSLSSAQLNWLWELSCVLKDRKESKQQREEIKAEERKKDELEFLKIVQENLSKIQKKQSLSQRLLEKLLNFFRK